MKAIIVIDEPNKCGLCPCYDYKHGYCKLTDNPVNPLEKNGKCPLKPMPKRYVGDETPIETERDAQMCSKGIAIGRNIVINEILGETE